MVGATGFEPGDHTLPKTFSGRNQFSCKLKLAEFQVFVISGSAKLRPSTEKRLPSNFTKFANAFYVINVKTAGKS